MIEAAYKAHPDASTVLVSFKSPRGRILQEDYAVIRSPNVYRGPQVTVTVSEGN